jgi:hypothetical protein
MIYLNFIFTFLLIHLSRGSPNCCFNSTLATWDNHLVAISNFNQLDQLKFNCGKPIDIRVWIINPRKKLILNNSLNTTSLEIRMAEEVLYIILKNFKGFQLDTNPFYAFKLINENKKKILWRFEESILDFYDKNFELIIKNKCEKNLLNKGNGLLSMIRKVEIGRSTRFPYQICPFIFKNVFIDIFTIEKISSSFIDRNVMEFQNVIAMNLNSSIFQVELTFYHAHLNKKLLNNFVFQKLRFLDLNGVIASIQNDLFKSFDTLQVLRLRTQNLRSHFVYNNKWLDSLNLKVEIDLTDYEQVNSNLGSSLLLVIYQAFSNISYYDFPDEDICYFKNFPHQRLVVSKFKPIENSKCSCTEIFLIQYSVRYSRSIDEFIRKLPATYAFLEYYWETIYDEKFSKCMNSSFQKVLLKCNFYRRLKACKV